MHSNSPAMFGFCPGFPTMHIIAHCCPFIPSPRQAKKQVHFTSIPQAIASSQQFSLMHA